MKELTSHKVRSLMMVFLLVVLFCGCAQPPEYISNEIISVQDPQDLDEYLGNEVIFFEKTVDGNTIIRINSLNLMTIRSYDLKRAVNGIDLSPNNRFVTYIHGQDVDGQYLHRLWLYNLDDKTKRKIAGWDKDIMDIGLTNPSFSPDGKRVIFTVTWFETNNNGLAMVNIDGSELEILNTNSPLNEGPRISPASSHIIVTCAGLDEVTGNPGFQLCLLDKNGLFRKQLTNRGDMNGSYYFTPDGKKIAYSEAEFGGIFQIIKKRKDRFIVMDMDGKNKKEILNWDVAIKGFSDDSQEIIFESRPDKNSPWGIYIINVDGSNLRHLTYFDAFLEEWYSDIEPYY